MEEHALIMKMIILEIIDFKKNPSNKKFFEDSKENIEKKFEKFTSKDRNNISECYLNWVRQLPADRVEEFRKIVSLKFGLDFYNLAYYENKGFQRILQKKKISNNDDLLIATYYVDNVPKESQNIEISNQLGEFILFFKDNNLKNRERKLMDNERKELLDTKAFIDECVKLISEISEKRNENSDFLNSITKANNSSYKSLDLKGIRHLRNDIIELLNAVPSEYIFDNLSQKSKDIYLREIGEI